MTNNICIWKCARSRGTSNRYVTGSLGTADYQAVVDGEGVWTYDETTGELTFNPDPGFTTDPTPIGYTIEDGEGNSTSALVTVGYSEIPPVANDDDITGVTTGTDAVVSGISTDDTLSDGSPVDANPASATFNATIVLDETSVPGGILSGGGLIVTVPGEGVWTYDPATDIMTFDPELGFTADPTPITYILTENSTGLNDTAIVSADYIPVPPIPQDDLSDNGGIGHVPNTAVTVNPFIDNGSGIDEDGDALAGGIVDITSVSLVIPAGALNVVLDAEGDVTSFDVPGEGNWSVDGDTGDVTFTPIATFNDDPTPVDYSIRDNDGNQNLLADNATITIDYAPIATNDINTVVGIIGDPVSIDVTLNDLDGDIINPATVVLDATSVGGVQLSDSEVFLAGVGTWLDDGAGNVTFTPDPLYTLDPPVIEYTIEDDEGNVSNEATITFDYEPIATDDVSDNGGLGHPINTAVPVDVLGDPTTGDTTGDLVDPTTVSLVDPGTAINIVTDANGDITSYEIPGEGTWNVDLVTGEITFDPEPGFILSPTPIFYNVEDDEGNQSNDALVTIIYIAQADIQVVKTDNSDTYTPGLPLVYTITVTNNGPANAAGVIVNDDIIDPTLEAETTWTGNGSTDVSGDITDDIIATLNVGDIVTYTVTIDVPSSYMGPINNTAIVALPPSTDFTMPVDPDPSNNSSTDVDEMDAQAALVVNKTVDNPTPEVGSEVTFTITVTNEGPSDATNIDVLDVLPTGYTLSPDPNPITVSQGTYYPSGPNTGLWDLGDLVDYGDGIAPPIDGSVATLTIRAVVNESGIYTNTAEVVYADQEDPNSIHGNQDPEEDDQDEATTTPIGVTDLITTKTVDNDNPNEGDVVKYTITVVNNGPSAATGVSLIDNLPAGLEYVTHLATGGSVNTYADVAGDMTWTIGIIDIGESATLTIDALVTAPGTLAQTPITNITTPASGDQLDPTDDGNDLEADIVVTASDLVTVKSVNNPVPSEGDTIIYSIVVTNNGPSDATGVSLTDLLPAGVTYVSDNQGDAFNSGSGIWTIGSISSGATATLTITATVDIDTAGTAITNTTTAATGDQTDPTTVGDFLEATIVVENFSDIVLTKVVDNATPNAGDTVTYTVTVRNNGPAKVTGLVVTDALPAGLTYGIVSPSDGTWTAPNWSIDLLESGEEETIVIEAVVGMDQGGMTLTNTVSNTQDQVDSDLTPDDASETIVVTSSDLVTVKTVSESSPNEGDAITYTIAVTNNGFSPATNVSLIDNLPAGVTYVSNNPSAGTFNPGSGEWTISNIAVDETVTLELIVTVDEETAGTSITNTTTAAVGDQTDPTTVGDILEATIDVENFSDIVLTKVVDNATPNAGDTVTYTVTVRNNGPAKVTGLVVTDALPAGLTYGIVSPSDGTWTAPNWSIDLLESGEEETIVIEAVVGMDQGGMTLTNTVSNTQDQVDSDLTPDDASETIVVTSSDLVTVKTVSNATPNEGDTITYTLAVTNNGPSDATGVSLTDLLPAGVTYVSDDQGGAYNSGSGIWTIGSISSSATATLIITATVDVDTAGMSITNTTTAATGDQTDPTTDGDILEATIDVDNYTDIVLTKVVDNATPNAGDTVTYTVTVRNNGPAKVTGLVVTDALPAGLTYGIVSPSDGTWTAPNWSIDLLESGEEETIVIEAVVGMDQGGMTLTNTVSNTQDQVDSDLTPDDASETIVVTSSDLVTVKTVSNATPNEGDTITYTLAVTNNGPSDATNVSLTDLLPAGVTYVSDDQGGAYNSGSGIWTIGSISSSATATLTITATVDVDTAGMSITNTTTAATGDQTDPTTDGDILEATIDVDNYTDIVLTKVVDNATPNAGDTVTYTVTVRNNGPAKVTGLVVTDALPAGLTYGIVSPSDGTWTAPNWSIDLLESGEEETIVIEAVVGMDQGGMTLTNTVSNTQDQVDSDLTPDDASETIVVTSSDLVTVKTVSNATPNEGDTITYTLAVTNNGPSDATNVSLIDNLPVGVTFVSHLTAAGTFNYGSGLWTIGDLANGATAMLTITATVDDGTLGQTITNTTSAVTADQSDSDTTNNVGSVSIVPTAYIDLSLTKWVVDDVVDPEVGDMITFEIRVDNEGPTEATGVQVTDLIPSGYDFVNYSSSIGTYNPITGLWNIGFIEIGNTAVLLVDVIVMDSGDYINCAEITAANELDIDSTPNNSDADEDDYDCASAPPIQELDLKVVKTVIADNLTPMVGTEVSFEIRLINDGNIEGTEVVVTDLLPSGYTFLNYSSTRGTYDDDSGKWIVGTIVDGETEVLVIDAIVNATGDYLNCATITEMHQTDTDLSNNTSCIATNPIKVIDLELTKEVELTLGNQGPVSTTGVLQPYAETHVDFTITVSNNGPSDATGVVVEDLLPNGYNFVNVSVSTGTYDDGSGMWNIGTITNGASETMIIRAFVNPVGNWLNVAEVIAANELDIDSTPNNGDIFEDDMDQIATEPIIPLTIPEGFTPNGDGINDVFEIEFLEVLYPNFAMEIVNRYGNIVYEYKHNGNPYQTPQWWDGYSTGRWNFSSDQLPAGTYFYTIYFNNDERKPQTGWIYLRK